MEEQDGRQAPGSNDAIRSDSSSSPLTPPPPDRDADDYTGGRFQWYHPDLGSFDRDLLGQDRLDGLEGGGFTNEMDLKQALDRVTSMIILSGRDRSENQVDVRREISLDEVGSHLHQWRNTEMHHRFLLLHDQRKGRSSVSRSKSTRTSGSTETSNAGIKYMDFAVTVGWLPPRIVTLAAECKTANSTDGDHARKWREGVGQTAWYLCASNVLCGTRLGCLILDQSFQQFVMLDDQTIGLEIPPHVAASEDVFCDNLRPNELNSNSFYWAGSLPHVYAVDQQLVRDEFAVLLSLFVDGIKIAARLDRHLISVRPLIESRVVDSVRVTRHPADIEARLEFAEMARPALLKDDDHRSSSSGRHTRESAPPPPGRRSASPRSGPGAPRDEAPRQPPATSTSESAGPTDGDESQNLEPDRSLGVHRSWNKEKPPRLPGYLSQRKLDLINRWRSTGPEDQKLKPRPSAAALEDSKQRVEDVAKDPADIMSFTGSETEEMNLPWDTEIAFDVLTILGYRFKLLSKSEFSAAHRQVVDQLLSRGTGAKVKV